MGAIHSLYDVRELGRVELDTEDLDEGDDGFLAVDGSPSDRTPVGAFGAVDGSGYAVGGWFDCPPELLGPRLVAKSDVCEVQALRMGLRDYRDGSVVTVIMDSKVAGELLTAHPSTARRLAIYRQFPAASSEVLEHRRRMTVTRRYDFSAMRGDRQLDVGHDPLMIAAHRTAYALKRFAETSGQLDDRDREWLAGYVQGPSNKQKNIKKSVDQWLELRRRQWPHRKIRHAPDPE